VGRQMELGDSDVKLELPRLYLAQHIAQMEMFKEIDNILTHDVI
jgi:hypothetical protein